MRLRAAALFLVVIRLRLRRARRRRVAAPAGAATGPLGAVTVSTDTAPSPRSSSTSRTSVKKTANRVVAEGTGEPLAAGETITFDYVLVNGRTGKEIQTSYGVSPASLVLDSKKTAKQLVAGLTGEKIGSRVLVAIAPKDGLASD